MMIFKCFFFPGSTWRVLGLGLGPLRAAAVLRPLGHGYYFFWDAAPIYSVIKMWSMLSSIVSPLYYHVGCSNHHFGIFRVHIV